MIWIQDRSKKQQRWIGLASLVLVFGLAFMILGPTAHAIPNGGYAHPEVLIQPEELKVLIDKKDLHIRIIDIREKLKYLAGHIPGAVHVWRPDIVDNNHPIPGMMAPKEQSEPLFGRLSTGETSQLRWVLDRMEPVSGSY